MNPKERRVWWFMMGGAIVITLCSVISRDWLALPSALGLVLVTCPRFKLAPASRFRWAIGLVVVNGAMLFF